MFHDAEAAVVVRCTKYRNTAEQYMFLCIHQSWITVLCVKGNIYAVFHTAALDPLCDGLRGQPFCGAVMKPVH